MKILDFVPYYSPHIGGLEKYAEELHKCLISHGDEIVVFTPNLPTSLLYEEYPGLKIIRYPAFEIIPNYPLPKFWLLIFWQQYYKLTAESCDVVFSTSRFFFLSVIAHFWARHHKKKRIHIEHGSDHVTSTSLVTLVAYIYDYIFGKFVLRKADQVITASFSAARFVHKLTHHTPPVIYRGMPFEQIDSIPPYETIQKEYKSKKIITYLGRLIHGKAVAVLIEAISQIEYENFIVLIIGDGPEMSNLRKQVRKLGLLEKVKFLGTKKFDEAMGILKASDIFVNPSLNEGLPTSVLEAAACGTTIVATNVGGTPEIVDNKKSAWLIQAGNISALKQALEQALSNPELRKQFAMVARAQIMRRFQWKENILLFRTIIHDTLIRKKPEHKTILHIITGLKVGGAEMNLSRMIPELQKYHNNIVCCLTCPGPVGNLLQEHGIPVHYLKAKKVFDFIRPSVIFRFYRVVRTIKPNVAITYLIHSDLFGRFWGKLFGIPFVLCWDRGSLLQWGWLRTFDRWSAFLVDRYIFQTEFTRLKIQKMLNVSNKKTFVIANAIPITLHSKNSSDRNQILKNAGIHYPENTTIICVSNLRKGKGHIILLRAFEKISQVSEKPLNLLIVGDGEQRPLLETIAAQMKSRERIIFTGYRKDISALLSASDIFSQPTFYEGMSNTILEAMANSCAIVTTDIDVNREIISHEYSGLLVPAHNVQALANALQDLIQNPSKRQELARNATLFVLNNCSPNIIAKKLSAIIVSLSPKG